MTKVLKCEKEKLIIYGLIVMMLPIKMRYTLLKIYQINLTFPPEAACSLCLFQAN